MGDRARRGVATRRPVLEHAADAGNLRRHAAGAGRLHRLPALPRRRGRRLHPLLASRLLDGGPAAAEALLDPDDRRDHCGGLPRAALRGLLVLHRRLPPRRDPPGRQVLRGRHDLADSGSLLGGRDPRAPAVGASREEAAGLLDDPRQQGPVHHRYRDPEKPCDAESHEAGAEEDAREAQTGDQAAPAGAARGGSAEGRRLRAPRTGQEPSSAESSSSPGESQLRGARLGPREGRRRLRDGRMEPCEAGLRRRRRLRLLAPGRLQRRLRRQVSGHPAKSRLLGLGLGQLSQASVGP
mmetsp:Transcript_3875/g.10426  ORF Transcript_3875/g.10426 Transcript_3875/m.10426 type:complete len:296 (+) Transcript_3875:634-1521(+)